MRPKKWYLRWLMAFCVALIAGGTLAAPAKKSSAEERAIREKTDMSEKMQMQERMEMMVGATGSFEMGSNSGDNNEQPVHGVAIAKPYALGRTEVTQINSDSTTRVDNQPGATIEFLISPIAQLGQSAPRKHQAGSGGRRFPENR